MPLAEERLQSALERMRLVVVNRVKRQRTALRKGHEDIQPREMAAQTRHLGVIWRKICQVFRLAQRRRIDR